ncbi:hypothetical protein XYCOK13_02090 [Xylanibacillus composti]|uniref:Uncharacterized protein n=1 Tax=Xylanibacillus composti TaxID=1572762 RepID=A0A8J4M0S3_9BACL|nr:hypothetical protein XYCOK13_02090 [Xylanibacillus composti]
MINQQAVSMYFTIEYDTLIHIKQKRVGDDANPYESRVARLFASAQRYAAR